MFKINYYGQTKTARTSSGAIRAAKEMVRVYGQGGKPPVIDADTEPEAGDLAETMKVANVSYCVRVKGQPVI